MTLTEFLEADRKKLISELTDAMTPDRASGVLEAEVERLTYLSASEFTGRQQQAASRLLRTLRMAVRMVDSVGDVRMWERAGEEGSPGRKGSSAKGRTLLWAVLTAAGAAAAVLGYFTGTGGAAMLRLPSLILILAGTAAAFAGGIFLGRGARGKQTAERRFEQVVDAERLYRYLRAALVVADQCLREEMSAEAFSERKRGEEEAASVSGEELRLFSNLFEAAYSGDTGYMQDCINEARFYLHGKHIEVLDYSEDNKVWFDRIPSSEQGTLRPALVSDGHVLMRGLASSSRLNG